MLVRLDVRFEHGTTRRIAINPNMLTVVGDVGPDWEPEVNEGFKTYLEMRNQTYFVTQTLDEVMHLFEEVQVEKADHFFLKVIRRITRDMSAQLLVSVGQISSMIEVAPGSGEYGEGHRSIITTTHGHTYTVKETIDELLKKIAFLKGEPL